MVSGRSQGSSAHGLGPGADGAETWMSLHSGHGTGGRWGHGPRVRGHNIPCSGTSQVCVEAAPHRQILKEPACVQVLETRSRGTPFRVVLVPA